MNAMQLRRFTRKYGDAGYVLVGVYFLIRWLWTRRRMALAFIAVSITFAVLFVIEYKRGKPFMESQYTITDLGTLPKATQSEAHSLNNIGQVVGSCEFSNGVRHAFVWQNGKMQDLGAGNAGSAAYSINTEGLIAGENDGNACLWRKGKAQSLEALPGYAGSSAYAVNDKGDVAGYCYHQRGNGKAFRWHKGKMTAIEPARNDDFTLASGINARSEVVGESANEIGESQAFVNSVGSRYAEPLPTLGGANNVATAINDHSQIVGFSNYLRGDDDAFHAFCWQSGKLRDLGVLSGVRSAARAINHDGIIVGWSEAPGYKQHAFVYINNKMSDLNTQISKNSGWVLEQANGINDKGQIVGTGLHNGQRHAFLLTPDQR